MPADPLLNSADFWSEKLWSFFAIQNFRNFKHSLVILLKKILKLGKRYSKDFLLIGFLKIFFSYFYDFICKRYKKVFIFRKEIEKNLPPR
jgi:hypothetical protein